MLMKPETGMRQTVEGYLNSLSAGSASPGGGSAAALAGAMGAALCAMSARLTSGRKRYRDVWQKMDWAAQKADKLMQRMAELSYLDSASYQQVMQAYLLPKITRDEISKRQESVQSALFISTSVPLEMLHILVKLVEQLSVVIESGNPNTKGDMGVAVQLARCAAVSSLMNIHCNLEQISDKQMALKIHHETDGVFEKIIREIDILNNTLFA